MDTSDEDTLESIDKCKNLKRLNSNVDYILSGTPYRILMGGEFNKDDIMTFFELFRYSWENTTQLEDEKFIAGRKK